MTPTRQAPAQDPLRFMADENIRMQLVCNTLEALAAQSDWQGNREELRSLRAFLGRDVGLAVADQEEDLFPMLTKRSGDTLDTESTLDLLREDHRRLEKLLEPILEGLVRLIAGEPAVDADRFRHDVSAYVIAQRQHVNWEEQVLLPLAEDSLSAADRRRLGVRLRDRRACATGAVR